MLCLYSCSKDSNTNAKVSFGPELPVVIANYPDHAMEPFIAPDGQYLFFNNLNDGVNTKLFYATKTSDDTFVFAGELIGTNQTSPPQLDAVPDLSASGDFYWTSTRNYPDELNNLFHGHFKAGTVTDIERVRGNFNKNTLGWLVMDHGISADGQLLYFNNAHFDSGNCFGPCETEIGVAQRVSASEFNRLPNSETILEKINDANYINYAPCISSDGLELYFTRYLKGSAPEAIVFEICLAERSNVGEAFAAPRILFSDTNFIEAPSLTLDGKVMYYHKKVNGVYRVMTRQRIE